MPVGADPNLHRVSFEAPPAQDTPDDIPMVRGDDIFLQGAGQYVPIQSTSLDDVAELHFPATRIVEPSQAPLTAQENPTMAAELDATAVATISPAMAAVATAPIQVSEN